MTFLVLRGCPGGRFCRVLCTLILFGVIADLFQFCIQCALTGGDVLMSEFWFSVFCFSVCWMPIKFRVIITLSLQPCYSWSATEHIDFDKFRRRSFKDSTECWGRRGRIWALIFHYYLICVDRTQCRWWVSFGAGIFCILVCWMSGNLDQLELCHYNPLHLN